MTQRSATTPPPQRRSTGAGTLRRQLPRSQQAEWVLQPERPDPVDLLIASNRGRLPSVAPHRFARMLESPFAFLRGAAIVMAHDLATTPATGLRVQLCGDAHVGNFGGYATPERNLVFDIDDFDETLPGPWEWDLKRLVASVVVLGRVNGLPAAACRAAAKRGARSYRKHLRSYSEMSYLDVWYTAIDAEMTIA